MIENNRLAHVYKRALELHKISWQRRQEGKAKWFWQKDTFDDSHLHESWLDPDNWDKINKKINSCIRYDNMENGKFKVVLTFDEALTLLLKPNYDNINYKQSFDIDLENYLLSAEIFKIKVK